MTFVYPLLLGGLLLAGVPVLLHFLVRQKPKLLPFPAFRFLMQKRRTNTRNLRLRHLLLLLLRIALLVLLCLALARPRLLHDLPGILSRERPVAMILVFDTSASMEYKSGDLTRLDLAKKRGLELLDQLPEDCRLLILDSSAEFGRADWVKTLDQARQRINNLAIRPDSTPVTKALDEAHRRFDEWDDPMAERMPRFICVFSDRTAASWGILASAKRQAKEDAVKVQTLYFDVGIDNPIDLAITAVELPAFYLGGVQQSFGEGETIELRVVVKATGKDTVSTLTCKIGDGEPILQNCPVQGGEQRTFKFDTLGMKLKPGLYQAEVGFASKVGAMSFNNRRFVTFEIRKMPKVLVLADDDKKSLLFAKALKAWVYTFDVRSVQHKNLPALDEYSAVFLDGVSDPPKELWTSLKAYVEQGGGVGIIPGGDAMNANAYSTEEAKKVMPAEIMMKVKAEPPGSAWNIQLGDLDHPFFRRFQSWFIEDFDISTKPRRAQQYWKVKPTEKSNVVVRYDDSSPAIVERLFPKAGKVLLLTTPMEDATPPWNDYYRTGLSFYPALTMLCTHYLCPESENPVWNYQFGATPPRVESKQRFQKYLLTGPGAAEEITFENGFWVGTRLPSAGNYVILGMNDDKQEPIAKFSINLPGEESDLTRVPTSDIEAVLGKDAVVPQDRKTSLPQTLNWDEPMELFPWLMLLFLFILALENLLANKFYRQEPATP